MEGTDSPIEPQPQDTPVTPVPEPPPTEEEWHCAFCGHPANVHNRWAAALGAGQCEVCSCRGMTLTG